MNVLLAYFSATENTANIASVIQQQLHELQVDVTMFDITSYVERSKPIDVDTYDACIFGSPVFSNRASRPVRDWLRTLDGKRMPDQPGDGC